MSVKQRLPPRGSLISGGIATGSSHMAAGGIDSLMAAGSLMSPGGAMMAATRRAGGGLLPSKYLAVNFVYKTLHEYTPGSGPLAPWALFSPHPPLVTGVSRFVCGLKDGSIILCHDTGPGIYKFLHYDPLTLGWVTRSTGGLYPPNEVHCVGPAGIDAVSAGGFGQIGGYNGTTKTWSVLGTFTFISCYVAATSLTDVWAIWLTGGTGELRHYNGTSWTTHRAEVEAYLGWSPWQFQQIAIRPDGTLYLQVSNGPFWTFVIRRSPAGVWSTVVTGNMPWPYFQPRLGLWSIDDNKILMQGSNGFATGDYLVLATGGSMAFAPPPYSRGMSLWATGGSYSTRSIVGMDANRILSQSSRYAADDTGIVETLDGGVTWTQAGVQPLGGWEVGQIAVLYL